MDEGLRVDLKKYDPRFATAMRAAAPIVARRFLAAAAQGSQPGRYVRHAGVGDRPLGISHTPQELLDRTLVVAHSPGEIVLLQVIGVIPPDAELAPDAYGRGVAAAAGQHYGAVARGDAYWDGDVIPVELRYGTKA